MLFFYLFVCFQVTYHHDGSESLEDSAIMKVALAGSSGRSPLPGYFQDSLRFTLLVNVTPVNDPPRLELNANNSAAALRLAQVSAALWFYAAITLIAFAPTLSRSLTLACVCI